MIKYELHKRWMYPLLKMFHEHPPLSHTCLIHFSTYCIPFLEELYKFVSHRLDDRNKSILFLDKKLNLILTILPLSGYELPQLNVQTSSVEEPLRFSLIEREVTLGAN